ncbi:phosphatidate cytidylyltransferase [Massilia sp. 9096]|uniref:phosphatidate cytidylyltransferase n=1 Tax=Massilia sp. 9096 TaxID=1500894 RepID=UPI00056B8965|nr:phosphatidate cytidylyltransferase [Massilia sp. 9096]
MLKTRVITAVVLLAVLLPILYFNNFMAFAVVATVCFGAAIWECFRLFNPGTQNAHIIALLWAAVFAVSVWNGRIEPAVWAALSMALWIARFAPSLKTGLPPLGTPANTLLSVVYGCAIVGCFAAIVDLFSHSPLYLLSVMAIVWVADIGAYFAGKAFGKRKLAPSISPGKSWEGAIGGGVAVLVLASLSVAFGGPMFADTFAAHVQRAWGWVPMLAVLVVIAAFSVIGDLFESQLKRRAGMKDSSNLLPGHGGVLDRIDALIPVLPLAALIGARL